MWNPFKKHTLLSEENEAFQIETFKWLLKNFGGEAFYKNAKLILPTEEYFPKKLNNPDSSVQYLFEQVKRYSGLKDWPCILKAQEEDPDIIVAPTVVLQNIEQTPLGTFSKNDDKVEITYNPNLVTEPMQLVATFSHELAHYLTSTSPEAPPGGWDNWEFATDITATFLGFGVFQANSVFNLKQYTDIDSQGWNVIGGGYLSEEEHSYALALFLKLKNIPSETALPHCNPNIKAYLKKALIELEGSHYIEELLDITYTEKEQPESENIDISKLNVSFNSEK